MLLCRRRFRGRRWGHYFSAAAGRCGVHSAKVSDRGRPRRRTHQTLAIPEEHRQQRGGSLQYVRRPIGSQVHQRNATDAVAQDQIRTVCGRATPTATPAAAVGRHQHTRLAQRTAQEDPGHHKDYAGNQH